MVVEVVVQPLGAPVRLEDREIVDEDPAVLPRERSEPLLQAALVRDAFAGVAIPFVKIHIFNVYRREAFRHRSYLSGIAEAVMCGLRTLGYGLALQFIHARLHQPPSR